VEVLRSHRATRISTGLVEASSRAGDHQWRCSSIVLATPHREAFAALPALADTEAASAAGLGATPILNVHVIYDRPVTDLAFAAAVDSPVQWVFDRTESSGLRRTQPRGQYLAVTVSAADAVIDEPAASVVKRYIAELAQLFPAARQAQIVDAFVTRERRATFRQAAGSAARRPSTRSGINGIWLAGAWTATGWPDTMESAVRSGLAAAAAVLAEPVSVDLAG
jgi:uncharacterized protein with NAD-binding domain and iron-sulfur cluster